MTPFKMQNEHRDVSAKLFLTVFASLWSAIISFAIAKAFLGFNLSIIGLGVSICWVGLVLFGSVVAIRVIKAPTFGLARVAYGTSASELLVAALLLFGLVASLLYFRYSQDTASMSFDQIRKLRSQTMDADRPQIVHYLYLVGDALLYFGVFAAACLSKKRRVWPLLAGILVILAYVYGRKLGARFPILGLGLVFTYGYLMANVHRILANLKLWVMGAIALSAVFISFNMALSILRLEGGTQSYESLAMDLRGSVILEQTGIGTAPAMVNMTVGLIDEYNGNNLNYLGLYIKNSNLQPALGKFMFQYLWYRVQRFDWPELKTLTDEVLLVEGIDYNVWCTAIRELWVDWGPGSLLLAFPIGFAWGWCHQKRHVSCGFAAVSALIGAWLLFSPWTSIHKNVGWEIGMYFAFAIGLFEVTTRNQILAVYNPETNGSLRDPKVYRGFKNSGFRPGNRTAPRPTSN